MHIQYLSKTVFFLAAACFAASAATAGELGYYRWPTSNGNLLIFGSEGDLWRSDVKGRTPVRLTTHPEVESFPKISNDGQWVAFDAAYDGKRQVYVMSTSGGSPKQVTFEGGEVSVRGWSPDGNIVYLSTRASGPGRSEVLRKVNPKTLQVETIPLKDVRNGSFSKDGKTLFFTRHGLDLSRDHSRLYRGGRMAQLWRFHLEKDQEAIRLAPDFDAPIRHPMWWRKRIYFISDKSGFDNIWSVNEGGEDAQQHSDFSDWDLSSPYLARGFVYYQRGADLFRFDLKKDSEEKLAIELISDRDQGRLRWIDDPLASLESSRMGAGGKSVALTARGRVAVAFPAPRRRVDLSIPQTARARSAIVSPDGQEVYVVLDRDRHNEIWRYPSNGLGEAEKLTEHSEGHIWTIVPSPDGEQIIFHDQRGKLWTFDLKTQNKRLLETAEHPSIQAFKDFAWSPQNRYLAYAAIDERDVWRIVIRDLETDRREIVTTGKYESFAPAFSSDGNWLYFVSNRRFSAGVSAPWGDRNLGTYFDDRGKLYALQLKPNASFPFSPPTELDVEKEDSEELATSGDDTSSVKDAKKEEKKDGEEEDGGASPAEQETIEFDGLAERLWMVPVTSGNYSQLAATDKFLYVLDDSTLKSIAIDDRDPAIKTFASEVREFEVSADAKKIFYRTGRGSSTTLAIVPTGATSPSDLDAHRIQVSNWEIGIVPRQEWQQLYLDAWRLHRSFAYDKQLRGVNWDRVLDQFKPLVARVGHRDELDDILAQMASELGILHSQIASGEEPRDEESGTAASLGAEYQTEQDGLRITKIYEADRDLPELLGPLRRPGVDVQVGDLLTTVNGRPVRSESELASVLHNKARQQVRLELKREDQQFAAIVTPVPSSLEPTLLYRDWLQQTRASVADASDGQIGFLHIRAMGANDIAAFARDFYEHYDKPGLIIDVRGNRGGNIDSWILGLLSRKVWAFWGSSNGAPIATNMQQAFRGHLVVLIDEDTYSDGETFAAGVKALDLAPLIGTTTAGAGIWLSNRSRLVDGGMARIAESAQYGLDGRWLIEGRGVSPDQVVINEPHALFHGKDRQLDAAIKYLQTKLEEEPIPELKPKPLPELGKNGEDVE